MATSAFNQIYALGSNYAFFTRSTSAGGNTINSAGKWDGGADTIFAVSNGVGSFGVAIEVGESDDDVFVGGSFTLAGGSVTVNRIAYYNGSTWDSLGGASVFSSDVSALAYDRTNNLLYAGSHGTTTTANRVSVWNGSTWTGISTSFTISNYPRLILDTSGVLYMGYGSNLYKYNGSWTLLSSSLGGTIHDLKYNFNDNCLYMALQSTNAIKYYDLGSSTLSTMSGSLPGPPYAVSIGPSNTIFACTWPSSGYVGSVIRHNGSSWDDLYNHTNTSGVLEIKVDSNGNIFAFGNSGGYVIGKSPYTAGNWETFSATTTITYGGAIQSNPTTASLASISTLTASIKASYRVSKILTSISSFSPSSRVVRRSSKTLTASAVSTASCRVTRRSVLQSVCTSSFQAVGSVSGVRSSLLIESSVSATANVLRVAAASLSCATSCQGIAASGSHAELQCIYSLYGSGRVIRKSSASSSCSSAISVVATTGTVRTKTIMVALNAGYTSINSLIPTKFNFTDETTSTPTSIVDGGSDMYDTGNVMNTNLTNAYSVVDVGGFSTRLSTSIPYTHTKHTSTTFSFRGDGLVKSGIPYFGGGSTYFTNLYPGMFVMVATGVNITEFSITGNIGIDGGGAVAVVDSTMVVNGTQYAIFRKTISGSSDPSINHIFIVPGNGLGITHSWDTTRQYDDNAIQNIPSTVTEIYYLLVARASGAALSNSDADNIVAEFIEVIGGGSETTATLSSSSSMSTSGRVIRRASFNRSAVCSVTARAGKRHYGLTFLSTSSALVSSGLGRVNGSFSGVSRVYVSADGEVVEPDTSVRLYCDGINSGENFDVPNVTSRFYVYGLKCKDMNSMKCNDSTMVPAITVLNQRLYDRNKVAVAKRLRKGFEIKRKRF